MGDAPMPTAFLTPRVNHATLSQQIGNTVRLVGEVVNKSAAGAISLRTSDGREVSVDTTDIEDSGSTSFVEIVGRVNDDLSVKAYTFVPFGNTFDMEAYNKAVELTSKFPEVF